MASHIRRNIAAEIVQDCPGIRIHIMDIIQPPGISMPPAIERQKLTVAATLATNAMAQTTINPAGSAAPALPTGLILKF